MNKNQNLKLTKIPTNGLTSLRVRLGLGKQNALEIISEGQFFKKEKKNECK
jgi:hypothetical protein